MADASTPPSRGRRGLRWLSWTAVVLGTVVLVVAGAGYGYYAHLNGNIRRVAITPPVGRVVPSAVAPTKDGAENILLVGSGSRDGLSAAQLAEVGVNDDPGGGGATDTLIVAHLAPDNGPVTLISIPRDTYVQIPGFQSTKINTAYDDGESVAKGDGPGVLVATVEQLTGLTIDHYISVNFLQFAQISDAIGGVTVCLTVDENDPESGFYHAAGTFTIKGAQALAFVRQRHNFTTTDGSDPEDFGRINRQQRFISAVVKKVKTIRNPATLNALLQTATRSLTVDTGESGLDLYRLANRLKGIGTDQVRFTQIPVTDGFAMIGDQSVVEVDPAKVRSFFAGIAADTAATPAPSTSAPPSTSTPAPTVAPSAVDVRVENGSGTGGLAATTRDALAGFGFAVSSIGDAPATSTTTIRYGTGQSAAAAELARAVPGATLVADATLGDTVDLVLGADHLRVVDPATSTVGPSTSSPPTPTVGATDNPAITTPGDLSCGI